MRPALRSSPWSCTRDAAARSRCGLGDQPPPAPSIPIASAGPPATVTGAAAPDPWRDRGGPDVVGRGPARRRDADRTGPPSRARLRDAPRAVYQVVLPDQPDAGFIVVYEFPDAAAAVDAGNEEAGYLGTGPAGSSSRSGPQHVLRRSGRR